MPVSANYKGTFLVFYAYLFGCAFMVYKLSVRDFRILEGLFLEHCQAMTNSEGPLDSKGSFIISNWNLFISLLISPR